MPEPSKVVLLEQLPTLASGTKIRLLGCIHEYHMSKATILLKDRYPATVTATPTAVVNIANVLENVNHELLQIGSWINVMGYARTSTVSVQSDLKAGKRVGRPEASISVASVEATMIWSAGAIKLDQYRHATREYQKLHAAT